MLFRSVWEVECFPAKDESGQTTGTVYIARDVSEEESLRRRTLLVQKMESVGVMAGGIAHEFNNVLAIIIGYTELCMEATTPGEKLYGHLKEIFKASGRARDVVRQMLTFSRGDDTPKSPLQVIPLVKETVRFLRASLTEAVTFERKNLAYVVRDTTDKEGELVHILHSVRGSAIVYVRSRRRCKDISAMLEQLGNM